MTFQVRDELYEPAVVVDMTTSISEIMCVSQHEEGRHKLSPVSPLNGIEDGNSSTQKQSSTTNKVRS